MYDSKQSATVKTISRQDKKTRPDTRLPQSRAGGQGPYLRSLDHLGRSSEAIDRKNPKKVKCDGRTDGPTDGPTKRGVESRSTRLKMVTLSNQDYRLVRFCTSGQSQPYDLSERRGHTITSKRPNRRIHGQYKVDCGWSGAVMFINCYSSRSCAL